MDPWFSLELLVCEKVLMAAVPELCSMPHDSPTAECFLKTERLRLQARARMGAASPAQHQAARTEAVSAASRALHPRMALRASPAARLPLQLTPARLGA